MSEPTDGRNKEQCKASATETQIHILIFPRSQVLPAYTQNKTQKFEYEYITKLNRSKTTRTYLL